MALDNARMFTNPLERGHYQAHIGKFGHSNGTVGTAKVQITIESYQALFSILIQNTHTSNTLFVSFDESTNWLSIAPTKSFSGSANENHFWLKGSDASTTYECLFLYEPTTNTN